MKNKIKKINLKEAVLVLFISIIAACLWLHLYLDDELDSDVQQWLAQTEKPKNLDNNVHIALMALNNEGEDNYQLTKAQYLKALAKRDASSINALEYPKIDDIPDIYDNPLFCRLNEGGCLLQLQKNRPAISHILEQFQPVLTQFQQLHRYRNFDNINTMITRASFDQLGLLYQLSIIQIYYHILDKKFELASKQLIQLMLLERSFLAQSSTIELTVFAMVNFQQSYQPLLLELAQANYANKPELLKVLKPLTSAELSLNKIWIAIFTDGAFLISKEILLTGDNNEYNFLNYLALQLFYKENMTLNKQADYLRILLLTDNINKATLISELETAEIKSDELKDNNLNIKTISKNIPLFFIENYRNIVGAIMSAAAQPRFINFSSQLINLDLRIILMNAVVTSKLSINNEPINISEIKNPYTNELAFFDAQKICFNSKQENVCVPLI